MPRTVLHISDLHFGLRFRKEKWANLLTWVEKLRPDVIVVTGDLVNSPWRWTLKRAKANLDDLAGRSSDGATPDSLFVIPGNHDTRLLGLIPFSAIQIAAAICGLLGCFAAYYLAIALELRIVFVLASVIIAIVPFALFARFSKVLRGMVLSEPYLLSKHRLLFVPFDSASPITLMSWATGHVASSAFAECDQKLNDIRKKHPDMHMVSVAIVHHHPLPLPFDSANENMMVMDNAGALLKQLSHWRIGLVLHGHKHHQHFARISIDPNTPEAVEVAVVSAGTPTCGGPFSRGFNLLTFNDDDDGSVRTFEAEAAGALFEEGETFEITSSFEAGKRRFNELADRSNLLCNRLVCAVDLDLDGDGRLSRELRGLKLAARGTPQGRIPGEFPFGVSPSGFVEQISVDYLPTTAFPRPGLSPIITQPAASAATLEVHFEPPSPLMNTHPPLDIVMKARLNNAFAWDREQCAEMHPSRQKEFVTFRIPDGIAIEHLTLHIKFPSHARSDGRLPPGLPNGLALLERFSLSEADPWNPLLQRQLVQLESARSVVADIPFPVPNHTYKIEWDVWDSLQDRNDAERVALLLRERLRDWLASCLDGGVPTALRDCFELVVRQTDLIDNNSPGFNAVFYAYDGNQRMLRPLMSTYAPGDVRRTWAFPYGAGLAGRAFRTGQESAFRKDVARGALTGYMRGDGRPVQGPHDIPEAASLAFAIAVPEAPQYPYAILIVSNDHPDVRFRTVDNPDDPDDRPIEALSKALDQFFTEQISAIM